MSLPLPLYTNPSPYPNPSSLFNHHYPPSYYPTLNLHVLCTSPSHPTVTYTFPIPFPQHLSIYPCKGLRKDRGLPRTFVKVPYHSQHLYEGVLCCTRSFLGLYGRENICPSRSSGEGKGLPRTFRKVCTLSWVLPLGYLLMKVQILHKGLKTDKNLPRTFKKSLAPTMTFVKV